MYLHSVLLPRIVHELVPPLMSLALRFNPLLRNPERIIAALFLLPALAIAQEPRTIADLVDSVSAERLRNHISLLESAGGTRSRVTFTSGSDSGAAYIARTMASIPGLTSVELDTFYVPGQAPYSSKPVVNVIGTLAGLDRPSEVFILGAHYDCSASRMGNSTWDAQWATIAAPGADDNATGVAAVLEIARILSDPVSGFRRDCTIKFIAFGSEESGPAHDGSHNGSTHYAQQARARSENVIGMVSVDMIGYNWVRNYTAIVSDQASAYLGDLFRASIFNAAIALETNLPPYPYAIYSDHEAFWTQLYPAILIIEHAPPWNSSQGLYTANPYYHKTSDTLGTVNVNLVRRVTQGVLAMTADVGGGVTSTEGSLARVPGSAQLLPNYPNPFNPATTISFSLPEGATADLRVYDCLGRAVALLAEGHFPAGEHSARFDASALPSGIYYARLTHAGSVLTRRMVLVK